MALGANVGATAFGQSQAVSNALIRARLTGRPTPIANPDGSTSTLVAYPAGTIGTLGGGFGGARSYAGVQGAAGTPSGPAVTPVATNQPSWWQQLVAPNSGPDLSLNVGTPVATTPPTQGVLNQANPNTTYVSPNTPQPVTGAPVVGSTGTQSGPSVAPTYNMPPAPDTATAARNYRAQHGLATQDDTDALNAESLAAAQAGRTYFNPTLAAQYGQAPAAGVYGPRTDVVNALTAPPTTAQTRQQVQNALLQQQGIY